MSGRSDGTLAVWNCDTGQEIRLLPAHRGQATAVVLSVTMQWLISAGEDNVVRVWDLVDDYKQIKQFATKAQSKATLKKSPTLSGKLLASSEPDLADGGLCTAVAKVKCRLITTMILSADERYLVSGGEDWNIRLWNLQSGEGEVRVLTGHEGPVTALQYGSDESHIISGSTDRTVRLWKIEVGELKVKTLAQVASAVTALSISPDEKYLAAGCQSGAIRVWEYLAVSSVRNLDAHQSRVTCLLVCQGHKYLISGDQGGRVQVWDFPGCVVLQSLTGHLAAVNSVVLNKGQSFCASCSDDGTCKVWDIGFMRDSADVAPSDHCQAKLIQLRIHQKQGSLLKKGSQAYLVRTLSHKPQRLSASDVRTTNCQGLTRSQAQILSQYYSSGSWRQEQKKQA